MYYCLGGTSIDVPYLFGQNVKNDGYARSVMYLCLFMLAWLDLLKHTFPSVHVYIFPSLYMCMHISGFVSVKFYCAKAKAKAKAKARAKAQ
jgi:hypothetical protein